MAFYPDELSPIDRVRSLGKQADIPDISSLKTRRQWKSLVLGKKDMGINNFATIAEEKEEEISSDGSQGANSNAGGAGGLAASPGAIASKKITFPKPRKYITSRVSERKEDASLREGGSAISFSSLSSTMREPPESPVKKVEIPKTTKPEPKQVPKVGKLKEFILPTRDFIENFALTQTPIESQWQESFSEGGFPRKPAGEVVDAVKRDPAPVPKPKSEDRKVKVKGNVRATTTTETKRDAKGSKKKGNASTRKSPKKKEEIPSTSTADRATTSGVGRRVDKGRAMNMKEVVNVYKNLAYGSKEEIKTFVENLPYVSKDESSEDCDKNLLPMMNLKALENKIKNFAKKSGKPPEPSTSKEKKSKGTKCVKRNRKAHIERLARHKVVKVPAPKGPESSEVTVRKKKRAGGKEPWKYVGMESILDKTYFVYPAYPKIATKTKKPFEKGAEKSVKQKKGSADVVAFKTSQADPKVKRPQVVLRPNLLTGGVAPPVSKGPSGSASLKNMNRPSAMTVCTVEFQPGVGQKTEEPPAGASDHSLLVYLHGSKAVHVKSPYSDKQFSRVKFFRKDEREMPFVKGAGRRAPPKGRQTESVTKVSLSEKLSRFRPLDLLDFDEDIQNITEFLRSQSSPEGRLREECQGIKKSERERWPREPPKEQDAATFRHRRRQRRAIPELHNHPHQRSDALQDILSPDSIINEISKNIHHLQYLPDTEDNRKLIGQFFDELDQRIEATRKGALAFDQFPPTPGPESFRPIPILGY